MLRKKAYFMLVLVVAAAFTIGGFTYSAFVDSATNQSNTFTTGIVDIDSYRNGFDTIPGPMFYTTPQEGATPTDPSFQGLKPTGQWYPGKTVIRSLVVYNQGSLDAVLDKLSAEIQSDPYGMASAMNVAVYKILPKHLPNGTPFAPLPGDDSLDQNLLNHTSQTLNPFILMMSYFGVEDLTQQLIENQVDCTAVLLYQGKLSDLTGGFQDLNPGINLKSVGNPFVKRGTLLAFVVQMDQDAGNTYQNQQAKFGFTVNATQK